MDSACAVCQREFPKGPLPGTLELSSGERVCTDVACRKIVTPCTYCRWTGIGEQPVFECTGPGCKEAICQLCEETFENNTWDKAERVCQCEKL
jgi:hypothetical protein